MNDVPLKSRQRLEKISHHFMGDSPVCQTEGRIPIFLPILISSEKHKRITIKLNNELAKKGFISRIVNTTDVCINLIEKGFLPFDKLGDDNKADIAYNIAKIYIVKKEKADIYILPYIYDQSCIPFIFDNSLIVVASNLNQIKTAYCDIKRMKQHSINSINTIMTYNDSIESSIRYFTKLSKGVYNFTDSTINNYGYLTTDNLTKQSLNELNTISSNIIEHHHLTKSHTQLHDIP